MTLAAIRVLVVTDHPRDFPAHVVVREQWVGEDGQIQSHRVGCLYDTVPEALREWTRKGGTWLSRHPEDDAVVVGCFLI